MVLRLEETRLGILGIFVEGKNHYNESHAHLISLLHEPFAISISNILQHQEILRLKDILADDNRYLRQEAYGDNRKNHHRSGFRIAERDGNGFTGCTAEQPGTVVW